MAQNRRRLYVHKIDASGEESFRKVVDVATVARRNTFEEGGELTFRRKNHCYVMPAETGIQRKHEETGFPFHGNDGRGRGRLESFGVEPKSGVVEGMP